MKENKKGFLLVIEGIDASGKATQVKKIVERLEKENEDVEYIKFPRYDSQFGSLVGKYLRGEFGEKEEVPVEVRCLLYTLDRYQFKEEIKGYLREGKIVVSDRYLESNIAYQTAEHIGKDRKELISWIEDVESRLPQSDLVIFLDVSPKEAYHLHDQKSLREYMGNDERDIHEAVSDFQEKVYENYLKLTCEKEHWVKVNCVEDGKLRGIEDIHKELWEKIDRELLN